MYIQAYPEYLQFNVWLPYLPVVEHIWLYLVFRTALIPNFTDTFIPKTVVKYIHKYNYRYLPILIHRNTIIINFAIINFLV